MSRNAAAADRAGWTRRRSSASCPGAARLARSPSRWNLNFTVEAARARARASDLYEIHGCQAHPKRQPLGGVRHGHLQCHCSLRGSHFQVQPVRPQRSPTVVLPKKRGRAAAPGTTPTAATVRARGLPARRNPTSSLGTNLPIADLRPYLHTCACPGARLIRLARRASGTVAQTRLSADTTSQANRGAFGPLLRRALLLRRCQTSRGIRRVSARCPVQRLDRSHECHLSDRPGPPGPQGAVILLQTPDADAQADFCFAE